MSIIFSILAALWQSQIGRMALVAVIAAAFGYHNGFKKGDEGRLRLKAQYEEATRKVLMDEAARSRRIVEESSREAAAHEAEMVEKDKLLEETNRQIEELEKQATCKIGKATIRSLNSSR